MKNLEVFSEDEDVTEGDAEKGPTLSEARAENQNLVNAIRELGFSLDDDSATILANLKNLLKAADKKAGIRSYYIEKMG